ncbi:MAG: hypothetical protein RIR00_1533 [Pseudomonadota bacterium]|jgi:hypothetical protein
MSTKIHVFSERIVNLAVTGNLVRLDLAALDQLPTQEGSAGSLEVTHRVTMPIEGFLQSFALQQSLVNKLIADGRIKPAADAAAPKAQ